MAMQVTTERINPAKAERYLNSNATNRKMRDGVAEKYANDMRNGKWTACPVPISFYADGDVADGQHRLWAIVDSATTQTFLVVRGLAREDGLNIDTGMTRTVVDNARISGMDERVSTTMITAARGIVDGAAPSRSMSNAAKLELLERYRPAAEFCNSFVRRNRFVATAPVLAAVGRAFQVEPDKERLKRFCVVLGTGFMDEPHEAAAVSIRNYLIQKGPAASCTANWRDTFLKVSNAIWYFMRQKPLTRVQVLDGEVYTLDGIERKPNGQYKSPVAATNRKRN